MTVSRAANVWGWKLPLALALFACVTGFANLASAARDAPGEGVVQLMTDLKGFTGEVNDLAFSVDGSMLAAAGGKVVRLYEVRTGRLVRTLRGQIGDGDYGDCLSVAFSPDNCKLVVGISSHTKDGSLRVYDTQDFSQILELVPGHELPVERLAFSRDGRYLATSDSRGDVQIFDWPMRRIRARVKGTRPADRRYGAFGFPTDDLYLLAWQPQATSLWAAPEGTPLSIERAPRRLANWLKVRERFTPPFKGQIREYDLRLDRRCWIASGQGKADGKTKHWVAFWNLTEAQPACVFGGHADAVTALTLNSTCTTAASADRQGVIYIWNTSTGRPLHRLASLGRSVYRAGLDQQAQRIGYTTSPTRGKEWTFNSFGKIDKAFDLPQRSIFVSSAGDYPQEILERGGARVSLKYQNKLFGLSVTDGRSAHYVRLGAGQTPSCYSLLDRGRLGIDNPIVVADYHGGLSCIDPSTGEKRRTFVGHTSFITSLCQSADGRFLMTSSTDRTIRLWSLEKRRAFAWVGFEHRGEEVTAVPAGSAAEKAGIRAGDRFLRMAGKTLAELRAMQAAGQYRYEIGQRVILDMQRDGVAYQTEIPLTAGADIAEPVLTLLIAGDNQWIMWTPQGYYDASPGAGGLLGFHINRGVDRAATFVSVHQFRNQLYRPDILQEVFATSDVQLAIEHANERWDDAPSPVDLRDAETIVRMSPPQVRILSPAEGFITKEGQLHVLAEITSPEGQAITDVRLLVNGRPGVEKGATVISDDQEADNHVSFSRAVELLPGENNISIVAANGSALSEPVSVTVQYDAPAEEKSLRPNLHLLAIGVSKYANEQLNLRYAHLDAEDFAAAWDGQRGPVYGALQKTVLVNEQASSQGVLNSLKELLGGVERRDVAVIFISAHGLRDDNFEYYLGTHDVDPRNVSKTALHFSAITRYLDQLPCKVLVFVDTCHSAGITGAKAVFKDPLYELTSDEHGVIVFSSSLSREISFENEAWGHGAFTKAILDTFGDRAADINRDGYLSLTELEQKVDDEVEEMTDGRQHPVMNRPATVPNIRFYYLGES